MAASQGRKVKPPYLDAKKVVLYILFAIFFLVTLFPFYWIFLSSITPKYELFQIPPVYFPSNPTTENYYRMIISMPYYRYLTNSLILATGSSVLSVLVSFMAAYAFARLRFRGLDMIFIGLLLSTGLPQMITILPLFEVFQSFGLVNSYHGLILLVSSLITPFTIWVLVSFIKQVPVEIEEAAVIDGASRTKILLRVVLPLVAPALCTMLVLNFISSWNELLYPLVFATDKSTQTLSVGLSELALMQVTERGRPWDLVSALSMTMMIPPVLLVLFFHRFIVSGLTAGAIK